MSYYRHQRLAAKHDKDVLDQRLQVHFRGGGSFFDSWTDGIVLITTTQSRMFYYAPVDDPCFPAHEGTTGNEYALNMNATVYYATNPFGLMACSTQSEICNPNNSKCAKPSGFYALQDQVYRNTLDLNDAQLATALRFVWNRIYLGGLVT